MKKKVFLEIEKERGSLTKDLEEHWELQADQE